MLMYIKDASGNMHEITDTGELRPVINREKPTTIRVIRRDSLPGKPARIKVTPAGHRSVTTDQLAHRLRQNWLAKYPLDTCSNESGNVDDSLTNLNWLQNLNVMKLASPIHPPSVMTVTDNTRVNPNAVLNMVQTPDVRIESRVNAYGDLTPPPSVQDKMDYKTNNRVKPPYSYATLISMAMQESQEQKMTLSAIYNWITENYAYYRTAEPTWQNSIRHNLSLNKSFEKVARRKDEPGKGGFWRINPEYSESLLKKRPLYPTMNSTPLKKIKQEVNDDSYPSLSDSSRITVTTGFQQGESSNPFLDFPGEVSCDDGDMLSRDFNWSALLGQDIQVDGLTIKTEDLLDETGDSTSLASPLIDMSPPPSDSNSDDLGLEDLLSQTGFSQDMSLDFTSSDPLDLTINGAGLQTPEWLDDNFAAPDNREPVRTKKSAAHNNVMNTPMHTPAYEDDGISWDHHDIPTAFDMDNLFDIENIPCAQL